MILVFLLIEFLDEFVFGAQEAAWPLIRDDLHLTYAQIGILLSLPGVISSLIEPPLAILSDVWKRRVLILGGGVCFALALIFTAASRSFVPLLLAFSLFYPASGAFVSLSQAALMDTDPARHEHNMARWTFAGSVGVVGGPLALGLAVALGLGWRGMFAGMAILALGLVAALRLTRQTPPPAPHHPIHRRYAPISLPLPPLQGFKGEGQGWGRREQAEVEAGARGLSPLPLRFKTALLDALRALRRPDVIRWLALLQFSDLMLDILLGFLALYMVDVVAASEAQAGIAVAVWSGVGLLGDFLLIPLLERVKGLAYLRVSAAIMLLLYPAFLLIPGYLPKLIILGLLGLFNSGWYAILQGRLYSALPGQSGAALAVSNVSGLAGALILLGIGLLAQRAGLGVAMWALLAGPVALLVGIPRRRDDNEPL